jgi:hypothetical protein
MGVDGPSREQIAESVTEFWLGVAGIYLGATGYLPGAIYVPDGILSIFAAFAGGTGHRGAANVILVFAIVLFLVGLIVLLRQ